MNYVTISTRVVHFFLAIDHYGQRVAKFSSSGKMFCELVYMLVELCTHCTMYTRPNVYSMN